MKNHARHTNGAARAKKLGDAEKHRLADLVRYLAKRAAERDFKAMQDAEDDTAKTGEDA